MTECATEAEHWEAWKRGETRCPYCVGLDMRDFEATCDCSRFSLETTGLPISFRVIGSDVVTTVMPFTIVRWSWFCHDCGNPRRVEDFPTACPDCGGRALVSRGT